LGPFERGVVSLPLLLLDCACAHNAAAVARHTVLHTMLLTSGTPPSATGGNCIRPVRAIKVCLSAAFSRCVRGVWRALYVEGFFSFCCLWSSFCISLCVRRAESTSPATGWARHLEFRIPQRYLSTYWYAYVSYVT